MLNASFAMVRAPTPVLQQPGGILAKDWYVWAYKVYLGIVEGLPQPEEGQTVAASPATYQAVIRGQAHVSGGTVSAIEFSRDSRTWYNAGITAGFVQMDKGDLLRVTYSVLPTLTYFPM